MRKKTGLIFLVIFIIILLSYNCSLFTDKPVDEFQDEEDDKKEEEDDEDKEPEIPAKWSSQLKLTASDAADDDNFGYSVSIYGDYVIVGAYFENGSGSDMGAAYIYHRIDTNSWDSGTKIVASDADNFDYFGRSVSIYGDYAIVGATGEGGAGSDRGAAYIYHRTGTNSWDSGTKIIASDAADNDYFGCSVSIYGDYAIAGAYREDGAGNNRGAVYIYHRTGTNSWDSGTKIIASDAADSDDFGTSVSISGDYAIAGAPYEDGSGNNKGTAYIYHRTGTNSWDSGTKIVAPDAANYDQFGESVSIYGDYAIAGAYREDGAGNNRGAVYIYHRTGTNSWDSGTKIIASDAADDDYFGRSVSIYGDYAVIGVTGEDGAGSNRGAAYIYHRTDINSWDGGTKIAASDTADDDYFGRSVSIYGDYSIVGANAEDGAGADRGAVYIFK